MDRSRALRRSGGATDGANRNDLRLLQPTLDAVEATGLHHDIATLHLDCGYDYPKTRAELAARGLTDLDIQRRGATKPAPGSGHRLPLGLRWIVEATNTWWSNYGQLRRSTDRRSHHRHGASASPPPSSSSAASSTGPTDEPHISTYPCPSRSQACVSTLTLYPIRAKRRPVRSVSMGDVASAFRK